MNIDHCYCEHFTVLKFIYVQLKYDQHCTYYWISHGPFEKLYGNNMTSIIVLHRYQSILFKPQWLSWFVGHYLKHHKQIILLL